METKVSSFIVARKKSFRLAWRLIDCWIVCSAQQQLIFSRLAFRIFLQCKALIHAISAFPLEKITSLFEMLIFSFHLLPISSDSRLAAFKSCTKSLLSLSKLISQIHHIFVQIFYQVLKHQICLRDIFYTFLMPSSNSSGINNSYRVSSSWTVKRERRVEIFRACRNEDLWC